MSHSIQPEYPQRVLADAIVDDLGGGFWKVHVSGLPPYDRRRTYQLRCGSDTQAAMRGIELFVEEMENLQAGGMNGFQGTSQPSA